MKSFKLAKRNWIFLVLIVAAIVAVAVFLPYSSHKANHAQEGAATVEKALISSGFSKVCSQTDAGHGPDNYEPWYTAYFKSTMPLEQARVAAQRAVKDEGFNIQQASQGTKGYLGDIVYEDTQTKTSQYADLESGKVSLALAFTNSGTIHTCSPTDITADSGHTVLSLEFRLPRSK